MKAAIALLHLVAVSCLVAVALAFAVGKLTPLVALASLAAGHEDAYERYFDIAAALGQEAMSQQCSWARRTSYAKSPVRLCLHSIVLNMKGFARPFGSIRARRASRKHGRKAHALPQMR